MVDQTIRRVADESSVSVVMDRRCSARRVKRTRDPGPEELGKETAPAAAGASAPQGARLHTCPLLLREDTHIARYAPGSQSFSVTPASLTPSASRAEKAKSQIGRFAERAQMSTFAASRRYSLGGRGIRCRCLLQQNVTQNGNSISQRCEELMEIRLRQRGVVRPRGRSGEDGSFLRNRELGPNVYG